MVIDSEKRFLEYCPITKITPLGKYFEITFESKYISKYIQPGQFVNIKLKTPFLRRPFTLFDKGKYSFSILVKVVGKGTLELSQMKEGQFLDILGPLGNSVFNFDILSGGYVDLVAGGVGIANMLSLAKLLKTSNYKVRLFWGIKSRDEYFERFEYFDEVFISSEDGSIGSKGFITSVLEKKYTGNKIYTCGPIPMIKAISWIKGIKHSDVVCSLETVMGCGIGICYGCNIGKPDKGYKLVCKDGPNFLLKDIIDLI